MLTFVALLGLLAALLSEERHPLFKSFNDPLEREAMAAQWRRKEILDTLSVFPLAVLLDVISFIVISSISS